MIRDAFSQTAKSQESIKLNMEDDALENKWARCVLPELIFRNKTFVSVLPY